jgi:acyl transferase domain-containing protein/NADPH:quinone reductase-like Zn-dependent oxidoreductase/acyl carrier protein
VAAPTNSRISPAKLALAVRRLRADRQDLDLIASDPIAIIGMACRFPGGANSPDEFWAALKEGRDCVGEIAAGRWKDSASLPPAMRRGGYLGEIDGFDAAYFGISPREAQQVDPQQRLLLEVTWEALWDAGIEPASLAGTDTGAFIAIYNNDYARLQFRDTSNLTAHAGVGSAHSVAAGRLSFLLNCNGPSLALDSACSSSLVAAHLACQSLRARECGLAIVGASSLKLLSDEVLVFRKWGMLASDGKCKTFDASADGFVPGEGSGVLILKRLSDALQDGDRVRAVIRGTAVNHDGRTTVLTAPNGLAQEAVLRAALRNAMLEPEEISYIEAHGTGTSLGDPIEVEAVGSVYGRAGEGAPPCVLGAVKTNLGHLEAAAGVAGMIKTVLCLEHGEIPKNLHFERLNPEISLARSRLKIPAENMQWARGDKPRVAGISSFGLGGTNGHILIEEAPLLPARGAAASGRAIPLAAHAWQRQRFWLAEPPPSKERGTERIVVAGGDSVHPLLGRRVDSPFVKDALFESEVDTAATPYLGEHRLGERAILPFAAFLEMAAAATRNADKSGSRTIRNFAMHQPRFLSLDRCRFQVLAADGSVAIASKSEAGWVTNAKGSIGAGGKETGSVDLANLRKRCSQTIAPEEIYRGLERTGLHYGTAFRTVRAVWSGRGESLAQVRLPEALTSEAKRYGLHPALLDGCLQTVVAARGAGGEDLFLPISVDFFELARPGLAEVWVHTKIAGSSAETFSADLVITDGNGGVVARLTGFTAKRTNARLVESLGRDLNQAGSAITYELAWMASPRGDSTDSKTRTGERWLLIEGREGNCNAVADRLRQQGAACEVVRDRDFRASIIADAAWTGVVYHARGSGRGEARGKENSQAEIEWQHPEKNAVEFVLEFVKSLAASKGTVPRLWIVSSSAAAVLPLEDVSVEQAPLRGLVRTLALEYPETSPVLIDAGPVGAASSDSAEAEVMLAEEIASPELNAVRESLVAFRHGTRYVVRMVHPTFDKGTAQRLQIGASGLLEDLRIESAERGNLEPHQVEIRVRAAGLNFRDVLTALGMFPARTSTPGAECSGTIVRVGSGVRGWRVGDDVLAFAPGSFQSFVTVPAEFVARKPVAMTFAEAAGIPVAFLTAYYGLGRLAKLSAGQSILIHAAAGGLGLAAVQLAMQAGARIFATAGSREKREFLRQLGVEHVFDSRSLAFRDEVLEATHGAGVDVLLNSLAGDFVRASFDVTAERGCFLEVGKRGIWNSDEVKALGKNIRYFAFDLGDVGMENPGLIAEMLHELMERFLRGELHPLPTALYSFEHVTQAFRTMAQARHIGKIVLGLSGGGVHESVCDLVSDGTVLITGGLGALGLEAARWVAPQGARKIVLAGRSAQIADEHPAIAELRAQGVEISIEQADVAVADQVEALLNQIRATGPPLCAVFHAAGVVHDSVLGKESWNSYREATAPKIDGAWNLHRLTENDPVRLMVFFSSAASILGSPGQGSYAAGNAFLDALAHHRASRGQKTLSVNWGAWASAGMAARLSPEQAGRWTRQGAKPMKPADALEALSGAIESDRTQVAILDMDWQQYFGGQAAGRDALFFELKDQWELQQQGEREDRPQARVEQKANILESIVSAPAADRKLILSAHVKACARRTLGMEESAAIQDDIPLQDVGLDSLMALEMRNELAQSLGLTLTAGLLFDYPSVGQLTQYLLGVLAASATARDGATDASVETIDSLSDEEAERLLMQELDQAEREKANA